MNNRLIIVSNRLPYHIDFNEKAGFSFTPSVGGLATGLGPLHQRDNNLWIGWADTSEITPNFPKEELSAELRQRACEPVYLHASEAESYYEGFSNSTLWPLFHGFAQQTRFEETTWKSYVSVNRSFCKAILQVLQDGDVVWVQDYHLMLLPSFLRAALPDITVGFFLHIPFPDYETFRMLPWRAELIRGVLGADLIGFHAYDYVRHFLSSCRRIAGIENASGTLFVDGRLVQVDAFPLGIDYERFKQAAKQPEVGAARAAFCSEKGHEGCKIMLSVERLDYSKGIPQRLMAYDAFLNRFPSWKGRVSLVLVTVPSRENVRSYKMLKKQVDELVGLINGKHSTMGWLPIDYYYRSLPFKRLVGLYAASDVMLVTPLRDGMNLVCKEYLACHDGKGGVLVLSEMAGASYELHEAITVNPFDQERVVDAMQQALIMSPEEQRRRNTPMQHRLARYTSEKWAYEFLGATEKVKQRQAGLSAHLLGMSSKNTLLEGFRNARHRALLLDYDGTLVPFSSEPSYAMPDKYLSTLLMRLGTDPSTEVVVISGRDRKTLDTWLGHLPLSLVAEHGIWYRTSQSQKWLCEEGLNDAWKENVRSVLSNFVDRTPGSLLEEKDYSLAWHYRACSKELGERRVIELKNTLGDGLADSGLTLMDGNMVIEVKPLSIDKGHAARRWFKGEQYGFLLAAGDDRTDEDVFEVAPINAWTIKIGDGPTQAHFALKNCNEMRSLLQDLAELCPVPALTRS